MNAIMLAVGVVVAAIIMAGILERFAKPASNESMGRMSGIIMVLVFVLLLTQMLYLAFSK